MDIFGSFSVLLVVIVFIIYYLSTIIGMQRKMDIHERLPWILYLFSVVSLTISLLITMLPEVFSFMHLPVLYQRPNVMAEAISRLLLIASPVFLNAGILFESFKPSWKNGKIKWWIYVIIVVFIVGYPILTYMLDHDGMSGNEPDSMLLVAGFTVIPGISSLIALSKAQDETDRKMYRQVSIGFWAVALSALLPLTFRNRAFNFVPLFYIAVVIFIILSFQALFTKRHVLETRENNPQQPNEKNVRKEPKKP